ncbi:MAG: hypothetical protein SFZ03_09875 [Candidatus Melainabacteria bacterium]|nr:hypothetical protein [Candidatus Melainabacteria bacterium]
MAGFINLGGNNNLVGMLLPLLVKEAVELFTQPSSSPRTSASGPVSSEPSETSVSHTTTTPPEPPVPLTSPTSGTASWSGGSPCPDALLTIDPSVYFPRGSTPLPGEATSLVRNPDGSISLV